jgi:hypothetical protein
MVFFLEDDLEDLPSATAPASKQEQFPSGVPPESRFHQRWGEESYVEREVKSRLLQSGHQILESDDAPQVLQPFGAE